MRWKELGEAESEAAAPLLSFKLLLHEAAGSAAELRLERPLPRPRPHRARSRGPHLLLPGHAPQRPLQRRAGALAAQLAQSGCAPGWAGTRAGRAGWNFHSGPALKTSPTFSSTGFPTPGTHSPYSQIPNLARRMRPERKTRNCAPRPLVRLPECYQPSRPKLGPNPRPPSQGEAGEGGGAGRAMQITGGTGRLWA